MPYHEVQARNGSLYMEPINDDEMFMEMYSSEEEMTIYIHLNEQQVDDLFKFLKKRAKGSARSRYEQKRDDSQAES